MGTQLPASLPVAVPLHLPEAPPAVAAAAAVAAATAAAAAAASAFAFHPRCELCPKRATVYCAADCASLCPSCDATVHSANVIVTRHTRIALCFACSGPTPMQFTGFTPAAATAEAAALPTPPLCPPCACAAASHAARLFVPASGAAYPSCLLQAQAGDCSASVAPQPVPSTWPASKKTKMAAASESLSSQQQPRSAAQQQQQQRQSNSVAEAPASHDACGGEAALTPRLVAPTTPQLAATGAPAICAGIIGDPPCQIPTRVRVDPFCTPPPPLRRLPCGPVRTRHVPEGDGREPEAEVGSFMLTGLPCAPVGSRRDAWGGEWELETDDGSCMLSHGSSTCGTSVSSSGGAGCGSCSSKSDDGSSLHTPAGKVVTNELRTSSSCASSDPRQRPSILPSGNCMSEAEALPFGKRKWADALESSEPGVVLQLGLTSMVSEMGTLRNPDGCAAHSNSLPVAAALPPLGEAAQGRVKRVIAKWHTAVGHLEAKSVDLTMHIFWRVLEGKQAAKGGARVDSLRLCAAACMWVTMKLLCPRPLIPKVGAVAAAAGVNKMQLLQAELKVLQMCQWQPLKGFEE